jgi:hypothetical protein
VGNLRPRQAESVFVIRREHEAIIKVRRLLDEESAAKLARALLIQHVPQLLTEQGIIVERAVED